MKVFKKTISLQKLLVLGIASVSLFAILINSFITFRLMKGFINNFSRGPLRSKNINSMGNHIFEEMFDNGLTLGQIVNSEIIKNMIFSLIFALILAIIIGSIVGRIMSKSLKATSNMAKSMQSGENVVRPFTRIKEIRDVNDTLEDFNSKLALKATTRKSKIDQLTHETRTPLTIIKSQLEAMQDGVINPSYEELEICKAQVSLLTDLIGNMGEVIESDGNEIVPNITTFYLSDMINQVAGGLRMQFEKKNIELLISMPKDRIELRSDKSLLSQSIMNILLNSYKYTLSQGKVTINCTPGEDLLKITITDTGMGISKSDLENIFKPYYRSNDVCHIKGLGLGLYIVKSNIEALSGTVKIDSELGNGTTVEINLPLS